MSAEAKQVDQIASVSSSAWEKVCKGTYAADDKRMFDIGFRAGYETRQTELREQVERLKTAVRRASHPR